MDNRWTASRSVHGHPIEATCGLIIMSGTARLEKADEIITGCVNVFYEDYIKVLRSGHTFREYVDEIWWVDV